MIRAVVMNALLLASLESWLTVAQAASEPELTAEESDVATPCRRIAGNSWKP